MEQATSHTIADPPPREFRPTAAILAWLWPGLGHIAIGEKKRGLHVMFGVLFLFILGLLIGGIDAVDWREDRLWFYAQAMCGPIAFLADLINQHYLKSLSEPRILEVQGLGRVNDIGTLFIALAGLMNFVVILDALHFAPKPEPAPETPQRRATD